ncbi:visual pigment-like receptor peropsin [Tubulanus polymorphus]|uniref:visual pigment-like receptor peropsin n=1 Tax=Tubulanus polymorphus TaxID=672921 RepID=UPI003DA69D9C
MDMNDHSANVTMTESTTRMNLNPNSTLPPGDAAALPMPILFVIGAILSVCAVAAVLGNALILFILVRQMAVVFAVWSAGFIWAMPPLVGICGYASEVTPVSCSYDFLNKEKSCVSFIISAVVAGFIIPLTATLFTFHKVYSAVVEYQDRIRETDFKKGLRSKGRWKRRKMALATDLARMSIASMALFCASWLPYTIFALVTMFYHSPSSFSWLSALPPILAKISTILHPVMFGLLDHKVRKRIYSIFCMKRGPASIYNSTEEQYVFASLDVSRSEDSSLQ